jgi:ribokinase
LVVFGSLNVDVMLRVAHLPAPGETVLTDSYEILPGGKGSNQAAAAARAGGRVHMVGCVGGDAFGTVMRTALTEAGVAIDTVAIVNAPTAIAAIGIDARGENSIITASCANLHISATQMPDALLGPQTLMVLQMEIPLAANRAAIARAKAAGARVLLNLAPASALPADLLQQLDLLVLNEIEASQLATALALPELGVYAIAWALAERFALTCVVTLGAQGCFAATATGGWSVPALPITPVDTTGAGDAFVGIFAAALDAGLSLPQALRRATAPTRAARASSQRYRALLNMRVARA